MTKTLSLTNWRKKYNTPTNKILKQKVRDYIKSKNWYKNSHDAIKNKFGNDTDLFIDLLASTSQRNSVQFNTRLAIKSLIYHKTNKPINFKFGIASHVIKKNVERSFKGDKLGGQKINAFAKALKGDVKSIVIDTWMMHVFNLKRNTPTNCDIRHIKEIINKLSKELNLHPCEVQACLWSYAKNELNDSPFKEDNDFSFYLQQFNYNNWRS